MRKELQSLDKLLHLEPKPETAPPPVPFPFQPDDILTPSELADRLKVSESWIFEQTRTRWKTRNKSKTPLPCIRLGKYLRFSWVQVSAWLAAQSNR